MPPKPPRLGLLLLNLGTPDGPDTASVRRYLRQFLSDPRVLDIPTLPRRLLLELVILPRRPAASAHAYQKVWTPGGSPLLVHGKALAEGVARELGADWAVELAMRYGNPSVADAMERLLARKVERIVAFPLYPHSASSSSGSSIEEVCRVASAKWNVPTLSFVPAFHDDAGFLDAWREVARPALDAARPEHVLISFHGLPERHVRKGGAEMKWPCLEQAGCCDALSAANRDCYRAQCHDTARRLAERLGLVEGAWSLAFQSRLGRTPWIRPYADERVRELARQGVKRLAVISPGFVADCLETLEELGIRAAEDFRAHGGEELVLVPSLNAHPAWVRAAAVLARRAAGE